MFAGRWWLRGAQLGGPGWLGCHRVGCFNVQMPVPPRGFGGHGACCVCSAVSYFSTRVGSIIGAGRLSFRVRDGSGRFPVAVAAVTLFFFQPRVVVLFGGGVWSVRFVVGSWLRGKCCGVTRRLRRIPQEVSFESPVPPRVRGVGVCVSFRPVSASSLRLLRGF